MCRTPRRKDFHSHSPMNTFAWSLISPKKRRNSLIPSFLRSVLSRPSQPPNILANPKKAPRFKKEKKLKTAMAVDSNYKVAWENTIVEVSKVGGSP